MLLPEPDFCTLQILLILLVLNLFHMYFRFPLAACYSSGQAYAAVSGLQSFHEDVVEIQHLLRT